MLNVAEKGNAKPARFLVLPPSVAFRYVGLDFTDRPTDEELLAAATARRTT